MPRLIALVLGVVLALSLGMGSVAHAMEPIATCVAAEDTGSMHVPGDADEVPADAAKGQPHHHGGCAGHQIATPAEQANNEFSPAEALRPCEGGASVLAAPPADSTLRPPIA